MEINLSNGENRLGKRREQEGAAPRTTRSSPRRKGKRAEKLFGDRLMENSPNLAKAIHLQIQKAGQISNSINPQNPMP